jgi:hypothetical protein
MTVSTDALTRYRTLLGQLLFEREAAGGELSEDEESRWVERLDGVWWQLSPEEQDLVDRELAEPVVPKAREELNLVDCKIRKGSKALPRRAA